MPHLAPLSPLRPAARPARAFTLIELLTVIAIIGILAAIIIPTIGKVRASARSSVCRSNLRQISLATTLYVNETGFFPYATSPENINWRQTLRPYMSSGRAVNTDENNSEAVVCPARTITPANTADSMRATYSAHPRLLVNINQPNSPFKGRQPLRVVSRPSQVILFADATQQSHGGSHSQFYKVEEAQADGSTSNESTPIAVDVATDSDPQAEGYLRYRHEGSLNAAFVDGHVEGFKRGAILQRHVRTNY
jgi:prepilin-type N-terminal cleavage/methylation domain-containing protein/prepilin-type processing-associated H-X9-DG protein